MQNAEPEIVCSEPKVFIGQVPPNVTEDTIARVFGQHGTVLQTSLPRKTGGEPRGFSMVRFERFRDAEAAVLAENGTFSLGGDRPLVVRFADPPKLTQDGQPATGISPKKLFVGQVRLLSPTGCRWIPRVSSPQVSCAVSPVLAGRAGCALAVPPVPTGHTNLREPC